MDDYSYTQADFNALDEEEKRRRREDPTFGEAIGQGFDKLKNRFTDSEGDFSLGKTIASAMMQPGTQGGGAGNIRPDAMAAAAPDAPLAAIAPTQAQQIPGQGYVQSPAVLDSNGNVVQPQQNAPITIPQGQPVEAGPQAQAFPVTSVAPTQVANVQPQPQPDQMVQAPAASQSPSLLERLNPLGTAQAGTLPENLSFVEPRQGAVAMPVTAPGVTTETIRTGAPQTASDVAGLVTPGPLAQTVAAPQVDPFAVAGYDERIMSVLSNPQATEDQLGQLRYDPNVSADIRENIRERMEPLLRAKLEIPKANAIIDNSATDPKAARQVYKESAEDKPEGSWLKAILLARLGMTDLAQEEFVKLGLGDSSRNAIVDGQPVSIKLDGKGRVKSGRFIGVDASEGTKSGNLTGEQLTQAMLQVNDPRVKVGSTKYEAVVDGKRQFFKELTVGSQTYWQNESTGRLTKSAPENLQKFGERDPLEKQAGEAATAAIKTLMERNPLASQEQIDRVSNLAFNSVLRAGNRGSRDNVTSVSGAAPSTGGAGGTTGGSGQTGTYGRGDGSAASVNNPSGLGARKDASGQYVWKSYSSPQEGVADTQNLVSQYLQTPGRNTPESLVGTWVTGDARQGATVQNGAYLSTLNRELKNAGVTLNSDGTIPNTPQANNAITRAIITHESGPKTAGNFLPYVGGAVEPKSTQVASATTSDAGPVTIPGKAGEKPADPFALPNRVGAPNPLLTPGQQQEIDDIASGRVPLPTDKDNLWKAEEVRQQYGPISSLRYEQRKQQQTADIGSAAKRLETWEGPEPAGSTSPTTRSGFAQQSVKAARGEEAFRKMKALVSDHPNIAGTGRTQDLVEFGIKIMTGAYDGDEFARKKYSDMILGNIKDPRDRAAAEAYIATAQKAANTVTRDVNPAGAFSDNDAVRAAKQTFGDLLDQGAITIIDGTRDYVHQNLRNKALSDFVRMNPDIKNVDEANTKFNATWKPIEAQINGINEMRLKNIDSDMAKKYGSNWKETYNNLVSSGQTSKVRGMYKQLTAFTADNERRYDVPKVVDNVIKFANKDQQFAAEYGRRQAGL